ncbi:dihydrofolate reductase family protein [Actinoplanes derwentensis]|uniref:Dihydrofolate reductase n=1 Tax=Actinoplanes derwentensis TaxID=113562 RepID=A0A1H1UWU4_9ACTN|nr:dihydrofolate reductase family protein [Actinoplanes derwentensis]GID88901.1 deaminase [Actinoplanes derwentensis]SDS77002.1 Dihydrofolate reductase [Actinoplanes derwentensis]
MSGRFVYWINVSLDLRIEYTENEQGSGSWARIGESLHQEFNSRARAMSLMVQGRVVYETMEGFWPEARDDASLPEYLREYGRIWTSMPKVLVSRTRTSAEYNTRVIDSVGALADLRAQTEGDIGVGGATLATELLRAGLLDELLLVTHPVVLGAGRSLFDGLDEPLELDLLEQARFDEGVTLHRYAVRKKQ